MPNPATTPTPDGRETRAITTGVEMRAAEGNPRTASGYAAMFNSWTDIGGYWRERFMPGAFSKSLGERDVIAVHSHDTGRVVGRAGAGTLTLREDATGLAFDNDLPDTSDGRDLAVQIERKDIAGMSFAFIARRQEWNEAVDPPERTIIEADLYEITYTACPQYTDTSVGLRSLDEVRKERREHNFNAASRRISARKARTEQQLRGIK